MSAAQLDRECRTYTRYLIGQLPNPYIVTKYREYHRITGTFAALRNNRFDRLLVGLAARSPFLARVTDIYASRFRKDALLRKKLVLLLALFECSPPACDYLDTTDPMAWLRLTWSAVRYVALLLVGVIFLLPVQLLFFREGRSS